MPGTGALDAASASISLPCPGPGTGREKVATLRCGGSRPGREKAPASRMLFTAGPRLRSDAAPTQRRLKKMPPGISDQRGTPIGARLRSGTRHYPLPLEPLMACSGPPSGPAPSCYQVRGGTAPGIFGDQWPLLPRPRSRTRLAERAGCVSPWCSCSAHPAPGTSLDRRRPAARPPKHHDSKGRPHRGAGRRPGKEKALPLARSEPRGKPIGLLPSVRSVRTIPNVT